MEREEYQSRGRGPERYVEEERGRERPRPREQQGYFRGQAGYENEPYGYEYDERERPSQASMDEREGYRREEEFGSPHDQGNWREPESYGRPERPYRREPEWRSRSEFEQGRRGEYDERRRGEETFERRPERARERGFAQSSYGPYRSEPEQGYGPGESYGEIETYPAPRRRMEWQRRGPGWERAESRPTPEERGERRGWSSESGPERGYREREDWERRREAQSYGRGGEFRREREDRGEFRDRGPTRSQYVPQTESRSRPQDRRYDEWLREHEGEAERGEGRRTEERSPRREPPAQARRSGDERGRYEHWLEDHQGGDPGTEAERQLEGLREEEMEPRSRRQSGARGGSARGRQQSRHPTPKQGQNPASGKSNKSAKPTASKNKIATATT
jgi:hypothetical protein